eukprot:TRINITY_DN15941_c0_g1_i1.p1 TRINITY_DN15941_c0_g1~~TRINITY_DN15941_c0_g1_i1.p1  ORF type:complete len:589 (+),score=98.19 TRINITY_DN15941_c0_g1_i1:75-1841(+)
MGNTTSCCAEEAFSTKFLYPMHVMAVRDAIALDEILPHQKLRHAGKVVVRSSDMVIIFVSHQWIGFSHPDKDMKQFRILQDALKALIDGMVVKMCPFTAAVFSQLESYLTPARAKDLAHAHMWYDFFSVPQIEIRDELKIRDPNMTLAVDSIPAYVAASDHLFVLAPLTAHEDTNAVLSLESWSRRGWCRVEMGAHYFSAKEKPSVICITKADRVVETFPFAWLHNQPRQGEFTVESDRTRLEELMLQICLERIDMLKAKGKDFECRFLTAMLPWIGGLEVETKELVPWLKSYGFTQATEAGPLGWAPVHFAALEGNIAILKQLLAFGESVNRQTANGDGPPLNTVDIGMQIPGMTPLMCAAFYIPTGPHAVSVAGFLIDRKADLSMTCAGGETALHLAAAGAATDSELVNFLVKHGADMEKLNGANETPLLKACFLCPAGSKFPNIANVQELVRLGSKMTDAASVRPIHPTPLRVACGFSSVEHIKFLLEQRADPDGAGDYLTKPIDFEMSAFPIYIRESCIKESVEHLYGGGPLHWAAYFGNAQAVEVLKTHGVNKELKNYKLRDALEVARREGHPENVVKAFVEL